MMNETIAKQHTQGPWKVVDGAEIRGANGVRIICDTTMYCEPSQETAANARLIARAPTLLAENEALRQQNAELVRALRFALDSFDPQTEAFSQPRRKPLLQMIRATLATVQA